MTRKIGRYEILGPLATGGMAEILLARLVGPSGFERPVVIKRIRPDLDHEELVSLFLEEARLAAKVRHANVVAVEDLGTDDGAPYLVMEYLEGESLSNVTRRLKAREEKLPFGVVAYIVAEACAGLHAAHELRDSHGEPVGLVHRDVSPQNVFVTYDGAIKVVDFGIARTGSSAKTEPGAVRGKFGYMAPEQVKGDVADRRTDVFALGIVLYELLTGHRLFKRFNQTATARAVLSDSIVAPTRVEPAVPLALEAICMRALSRPPEQRYATAAEMRRELLVAMRDLASEEPSAELAEAMVRSFPDRIDDKRVLLRNVREGSVVDHIPVGDIDVTIDIPGIEELPVGAEWGTPGAQPPPSSQPFIASPAAPTLPHVSTTGTSPSMSASLTSSPIVLVPAPTEPRRSRALWPVAVLLLFVGGGVAASVRIVHERRAMVRAPEPASQPSAAPATPFEAPQPSAEALGSRSTAPPSATPPVASVQHIAPPASGGRRVRPPPPGTLVMPAPPAPPAETATPAPSASARGFRRFQ